MQSPLLNTPYPEKCNSPFPVYLSADTAPKTDELSAISDSLEQIQQKLLNITEMLCNIYVYI